MLTKQDIEWIASNVDKINAPYKFVRIDESNGGNGFYIRVSLDAQETWNYGIFHNSRHIHFFYHTEQDRDNNQGKLRGDSDYRTGKFRKCTPKSAQDVIVRINKWVAENA